jgi:23S rRNA (guanosine2251-2'-O)-methyltransferase
VKKDIVCGVHPVTEVLLSSKRAVFMVFVDTEKSTPAISRIIKLAKRRNIKINRTDRRDLDRLSGANVHQGVVAFVEPLTILSLHQAVKADRGKSSVWLAVDEITDPQNLGTMIRSAVCFGVEFLVLAAHRTAAITPAVYKAASGAMENIKIVGVSNLNWAILTLKEKGYWIYGADVKGELLTDVSYNIPAVLIIGAEGSGLRHQTRRHCDELVKIPQTNTLQSLNAACAASVVLYDIYCKMKLKR